MKIYSILAKIFPVENILFLFPQHVKPSETEAYHIHITQFVFIFAVAHILFSLPLMKQSFIQFSHFVCFLYFVQVEVSTFIVCFPTSFSLCIYIKIYTILYLYTFYVFYFISYLFINFCCWAQCLVYARCTNKQLKIHLPTSLYVPQYQIHKLVS